MRGFPVSSNAYRILFHFRHETPSNLPGHEEEEGAEGGVARRQQLSGQTVTLGGNRNFFDTIEIASQIMKKTQHTIIISLRLLLKIHRPK